MMRNIERIIMILLGLAIATAECKAAPEEAPSDSVLYAEYIPWKPIEISDLKIKVPKASKKKNNPVRPAAAAGKAKAEDADSLKGTALTDDAMKARVDSIRIATMAPLELPDLGLANDMTRPLDLKPDFSKPVPRVKGQYAKGTQQSIYNMPYSMTGKCYDWKHLWINTGILTGAFVGTLFVLECLPEDATSWNRAELQDVPLFERWYDHVIRKGPEWDHDNAVFNYVLHPYAGAAYFMGARSCGFNFYQSMLYSAIISTVGWEFGIEAFMERPSYQDIVITPVVGAAIGEGFYKLKRHIVDHNYRLFDSRFLGNVVAFLIDPLNEVVGYFGGGPARKVAAEKEYIRKKNNGAGMALVPGFKNFTLRITF